jgi:SAM-dependent methyltransferase
MHSPTAGLFGRIKGRLARLSRRLKERVESLPLRFGGEGPSIPPPRLLELVSGTCDARRFLRSGRAAADVVQETLARHGMLLEQCAAVLDFGCGAGRVMRHWADLVGPSFHGADSNPRLIAWCRRHLPFASYEINRLDQGLEAADASFDVIYAFSVFTHMAPARQEAWMAELRRVLRPGGFLLVTLHGEYYLPSLSPSDRARFRAGSLVVTGAHREGSNECAAFHPEAYVRIVLARDWQVLERLPEGARGNPHQDLYLLRKPAQAQQQAA